MSKLVRAPVSISECPRGPSSTVGKLVTDDIVRSVLSKDNITKGKDSVEITRLKHLTL
jgi:hypothetical protein